MALRNQPYLPLYIQDFLTDEKLIECSAESTGVYIRLLCILHKTEEYGKLLLKQKDKQKDEQVKNFALKLLKQMPYTLEVIERSLKELLDEGVVQIQGDILYQKRMVKDNDISLKRAESGKKGGQNTWKEVSFAKAKEIANTENENENENENINISNININKRKFKKPTVEEIAAYCLERKNKINPQTFIDHYTSNGWRVGKNPMSDWKAAVRTWEKNNFEGSNGNGTGKRNYQQHTGRELPPDIAESADATTREWLEKKRLAAAGKDRKNA